MIVLALNFLNFVIRNLKIFVLPITRKTSTYIFPLTSCLQVSAKLGIQNESCVIIPVGCFFGVVGV